MLKQKIKTERNNRHTSKSYQSFINFFAEELEDKMIKIQKAFLSGSSLPKTFYNQLQENQATSPEKIEFLKTALNNPKSLIFRPGVQKILIKIAQEKIAADVFAGKIQLFDNLEADKDDFKDTLFLRTQDNGYEIDPEIAQKIADEDLNDYENKQTFLFFDILADLVNTQEFKQILQDEFLYKITT